MKQVRKLLLVMFTSILVMASSSATANQNNSNDLDLIFGVSATQSMELSLLSAREMRETEGEVLPAIIVWTGVRWVIVRYVSNRVAVKALQKGCSVYCPRASQARSLAKQAFGKSNVVRHGPKAHTKRPIHYSHYQPKIKVKNKPTGHSFYGSRLR